MVVRYSMEEGNKQSGKTEFLPEIRKYIFLRNFHNLHILFKDVVSYGSLIQTIIGYY